KSLSFSKSVELHDKVIGHYLNIKHYQYVGVITWTLCAPVFQYTF
ncbi:IS1 family transposase, partial [Escherichia coli]